MSKCKRVSASSCIAAIKVVRHPCLWLFADVECHRLLDDLTLAALAIAIIIDSHFGDSSALTLMT